VSCQFNAKSGAIDQLTLGDRPVDCDRRVGQPWCTGYNFYFTDCSGYASNIHLQELITETAVGYYGCVRVQVAQRERELQSTLLLLWCTK